MLVEIKMYLFANFYFLLFFLLNKKMHEFEKLRKDRSKKIKTIKEYIKKTRKVIKHIQIEDKLISTKTSRKFKA